MKIGIVLQVLGEFFLAPACGALFFTSIGANIVLVGASIREGNWDHWQAMAVLAAISFIFGAVLRKLEKMGLVYE